MNIDSNRHESAIRCNLSYGPIFGGCDIAIANNANTTIESRSYLGDCYRHLQYAKEQI